MFSIRLKELRQKNGLSQRELAQILKVSTGTVGNWEVGSREPDFETLIKIADYFNVSCDYLLPKSPQNSTDSELMNKISVTPLEEEMISEFRKLGKTLGTKGQQTLISIAKILNEIK